MATRSVFFLCLQEQNPEANQRGQDEDLSYPGLDSFHPLHP